MERWRRTYLKTKKKYEKMNLSDSDKILLRKRVLIETVKIKKMPLKALRGMKWQIKEIGIAWAAEIYSTDKIESYSVISTEQYRPVGPPNTVRPTQIQFIESFAIRVIPEDYIVNIGAGNMEGAINGKKVARSMFNIHLKRYLEKYCPEFAKDIDKKTYEVAEFEKVLNDFTEQCN